MSDRIHVAYFSDILCVWAYVAQVRLDELRRHYGPRIEVSQHFIPIFGDCEQRLGRGWRERGGFEGYAAHIGEICADFPHIDLCPRAWVSVRPTSSAPGHQYLKALQRMEAEGAICGEPVDEFEGRSLFEESIWRLRQAFFRDGRDVSRGEVLRELAGELELPRRALQEELESGRALAAVCRDAELRTEHQIEGSPTYLLNHGRQKLYGNLGYKLIEANIEELLRQPSDSATWC